MSSHLVSCPKCAEQKVLPWRSVWAFWLQLYLTLNAQGKV
jgi:hypothetical protein